MRICIKSKSCKRFSLEDAKWIGVIALLPLRYSYNYGFTLQLYCEEHTMGVYGL